METEGIIPVLEVLRSALLPLGGGDHPLPSVPLTSSQHEVPKEVCDWIRQLGSHLEAHLGRDREDQLRLQNLERLLTKAEHRQKADEERLGRLEAELAASRETVSSFEGEKGKESAHVAELKRQQESMQADLALTKGRLDRSESEKMELSRVLERKQVEMDSLNDQLEALLKKQAQSRQDLLAKEAALEEARRQLSLAQCEATSLAQQGETARKQAEWTSSELEKTIAELRDYRKQKAEEIAGLRGETEQAQSQALALERQLNQLKGTLEEREAKIEQILQQLLQARNEAAEKERVFLEEMDTKSKLASLYQSTSEEALERVKDLEAQLEEAQESLRTVDERISDIQLEHQQNINKLTQLLEEKEALISSLKAQVSIGDGPGALSFSAGAAMQTVKSGQSFSQVYAELTQTRTGLLEATQENERLKTCLRDICEDIEARLPGIQADREENAKLKATVSSLSERMMSLSKERDRLQVELTGAMKEKENLAKETKALEMQVTDLGRQVQSLLLQQESLNDQDQTDSQMVDSNQIISSRLVTVKSVAELQVRNQELLRVVRDLASRAEAAEAQNRALQEGSAMQSQLEDAMKELSQLREARAKQNALVENLLTSHSTGSINHAPSNHAISTNAAAASMVRSAVDLTSYNDTGDKMSQPLYDGQLVLKLEESRAECMTAKAALAKAQAKAEFTQERLDLLRSNYEACRSELEQNRQLQSEQAKNLSRVQSELQSMLTEVMGAREAARRAESELAIMRTTLSVSQATERRLAGDKEALQEEKQKLSNLLSGLQAMIAESEASSQTLRERLTGQVEFLERELQLTRRKLEETMEGHRLETAALGRENKELHEKVNKLYEELSQAASKREKAGTASTTIPSASSSGEEQALRAQIERFKGLNEANERSLIEISQAYDEYRGEAAGRLAELESMIAGLQSELASTRSEHEQRELAWSQERSELTKRLSDLAELETMMNENAGMRAEDVSRLHSLLEETQAALEKEKASHLTDSEQLSTAQAELRQVQAQLDGLNNSLSQTQNQLARREAELLDRLKDAEGERKRAVDRAEEIEKVLQGKLSVGGGSGGDEEVVGYLRRQKDALSNELSTIQQDNRRLQSQLDQTMSLLDEARARLTEEQEASKWQGKLTAEYEQLQARLASLGDLREANIELSNQVDQLTQRLAATEAEGRRLYREFEEQAGKLREAQAAESAHAEHLRVLTSDRDTWKQRCLNNGTSNSKDDEEVERLQAENAKLKEDQQKLIDRGEIVENKMKRLLQQCQVIKSQNDELKRTAATTAQVSITDEALAALKSELEEKKGALEALSGEKDQLAAKLTKYQAALSRYTTMRTDYDALRLQHENLLAQQQQQAGSLKGIEDVKREHEMHKQLLTSQWQAKVNKLQLQVDQLQSQLAAQQEEEQEEEEDKGPMAKRHRPENDEQQVASSLPVVQIAESLPTVTVIDEQGDEQGGGDELEEYHDDDEDDDQEHHDIADEQEMHTEDDEEDEQEQEGEEYHDHDEDEHMEAEEQNGDAVMEQAEQVNPANLESNSNNVITPLETPEVQAEARQAESVEEFDIDQFLVDQDMMMGTFEPAATTSNSVDTKRVISTSPVRTQLTMPHAPIQGRTIPTSAAPSVAAPTSVTSGTTFTPAPIVKPAGTGRIIDLSQTGKKPTTFTPIVFPSTTATEGGTNPAGHSSSGGPLKAGGRGAGHHLVRGGRGRGKFLKRGGGGPAKQ